MEKRKSTGKTKYRYGRRRSRSLGGIISADLAEIIDKSLQPSERLKTLIEYSLQNAFHIAEREICGNVDSFKFTENSAKCLANIDKCIEEQNLYNLAITGDESFVTQTPSEEHLLQYKTKLDEENKKWDELLVEERKKLSEASNNLKNLPDLTFEGELDFSKYKSLDYSKIVENQSTVQLYEFKVKKLKNITRTLSQFAELTNKYSRHLAEESKRFCLKTSQATPKTMMMRMYRRK